jgi:NAD(P)-dependent dehydrogenase (short-subunit alcohol dehydrogenase family)
MEVSAKTEGRPRARLEDKVAIITGAAQGIGKGCALRCAEEGATVVTVDLQADDSTAIAIESAGGVATHLVGDVRSAASWEYIVAEAKRLYGGVDLLGNVAGVVNLESPDTVVELTEDAWQTVIDTDLKGVWLGMRAVIPLMAERGEGCVVNISSLAALKGMFNLAAYSAAKGGVVSLTMQAAMEYAGAGVRVNCICPGNIDTPILESITPEMREEALQSHMLKRIGKPADIAACMVHFFSADGAFLTASILPVDGGWNANGRSY